MKTEKLTVEQNKDEVINPYNEIHDLLKPKGKVYEGCFLKGLDKVVSRSDFHPSQKHAWFKNGYLYATNARIALKVKLDFLGLEKREQELLEGKSFELEALKELSRINANTNWYINELGLVIFDIKIILFSCENHNFPNIDAVIPTEKSNVDNICIRPEFIKTVNDIYESMGGQRESLILEFCGQNGPVKLVGEPQENFEAIIMPIKIIN